MGQGPSRRGRPRNIPKALDTAYLRKALLRCGIREDDNLHSREFCYWPWAYSGVDLGLFGAGPTCSAVIRHCYREVFTSHIAYFPVRSPLYTGFQPSDYLLFLTLLSLTSEQGRSGAKVGWAFIGAEERSLQEVVACIPEVTLLSRQKGRSHRRSTPKIDSICKIAHKTGSKKKTKNRANCFVCIS